MYKCESIYPLMITIFNAKENEKNLKLKKLNINVSGVQASYTEGIGN